jgi:molybdopterin-guanine dinucleotide biosynthesis protein
VVLCSAACEKLRSGGHIPAVIAANFVVHTREIFVIMGLSGSGKSTLVRELRPYRLMVGLAECRRINGVVRQSHVMTVGSVPGAVSSGLLARRTVGGRRSGAAALLGREREWSETFWTQADLRLARLGNRLTPDQVANIRDRIAGRIPRP